MIKISDDKILGLKRKVEELIFERDKITTQFILKLRVIFFKNDNGNYGDQVTDNLALDPSNKFGDSFVTLIASANTFVNPQTGQKVEPLKEVREIDGEQIEVEVGYPEGTITMYQFYSNIPKAMVSEYTAIIKGIDLMIPVIVAQEDAKGTFDNV